MDSNRMAARTAPLKFATLRADRQVRHISACGKSLVKHCREVAKQQADADAEAAVCRIESGGGGWAGEERREAEDRDGSEHPTGIFDDFDYAIGYSLLLIAIKGTSARKSLKLRRVPDNIRLPALIEVSLAALDFSDGDLTKLIPSNRVPTIGEFGACRHR